MTIEIESPTLTKTTSTSISSRDSVADTDAAPIIEGRNISRTTATTTTTTTTTLSPPSSLSRISRSNRPITIATTSTANNTAINTPTKTCVDTHSTTSQSYNCENAIKVKNGPSSSSSQSISISISISAPSPSSSLPIDHYSSKQKIQNQYQNQNQNSNDNTSLSDDDDDDDGSNNHPTSLSSSPFFSSSQCPKLLTQVKKAQKQQDHSSRNNVNSTTSTNTKGENIAIAATAVAATAAAATTATAPSDCNEHVLNLDHDSHQNRSNQGTTFLESVENNHSKVDVMIDKNDHRIASPNGDKDGDGDDCVNVIVNVDDQVKEADSTSHHCIPNRTSTTSSSSSSGSSSNSNAINSSSIIKDTPIALDNGNDNDNNNISTNTKADDRANTQSDTKAEPEPKTEPKTDTSSGILSTSTSPSQRSSQEQAQDDYQEEEEEEGDRDSDYSDDSEEEFEESCPISPHSLHPTKTTSTTTTTTTTSTSTTTSERVSSLPPTILQNLISNYIPCPYRSHWATTYQANDPCEDRYASLANIILASKPHGNQKQQQQQHQYPTLIRMSLFTVLDGHGGPAVADYASKKLLPLLARNINSALNCDFLHSGQFDVNGTGLLLHNLPCRGRNYGSDGSNKTINGKSIVYTVDEKCYLKRMEVKNKKVKRERNKTKCNTNICSCGYHHDTKRKSDFRCQDHDDNSNIIHNDNDEEYGMLTDSDDDGDDNSFNSCDSGDFDEDCMDEYVPSERWYKAPDGPSDNDGTEEGNSIKNNNEAEDANDHDKCTGGRIKNEGGATELDNCSSSSSHDHTSNHNDSCDGNEGGEWIPNRRGDTLTPHIQPELSPLLPTSIQQQKGKAVRSVSDEYTSMTSSASLPVTDSSSNSSDSSTTSSSATIAEKDQDETDHKQQEQRSIHDLSKVIQKSFIELDEDWMNSIDVEATHQSRLVHNGKWNAGSCCLVAIIIQELEPIQSLLSFSPSNCEDDRGQNDNAKQYSGNGNDTNGDDDMLSDEDEDIGDERFIRASNDECSNKHINGGYQPGKPILYTAHVGDCRATLLTSNRSNILPNDFDEYDSSSSEEEEEPSSDHLLCHEKICKRKFSVSCNNLDSSVSKRRRLNNWGIEDEDRDEDIFPTKSSSSLSDFSDTTIQNFEPSPLSKNLHSIDLTEDHTPYNEHEAELVRKRCNDAPHAISSSISGGIMRVAGSLSVTRALGNAYLKTPELSFQPFQDHAPYITSLPEISCRILEDEDRILFLASDGVWERVNGENVKQCIQGYYRKKQKAPALPSTTSSLSSIMTGSMQSNRSFHHTNRMRMLPTRSLWEKELPNDPNEHILSKAKVSDAIVSMVLNRVKKRHKFESMKALLDLPKGYDRRAKHDDITNMTIDLQGFIL